LWADGRADQVATLRGLGVANSIGMTVAGVGLAIGIARCAGRPAVEGIVRTLVVVGGGGVVGAVVGRLCVDRLAAVDLTSALVGGVVGALACGAVVVAAAWLGDRGVVRALTEHRDDVGVPEGSPGEAPPVG
jgi:putative peptidoglycan lipid II flippase